MIVIEIIILALLIQICYKEYFKKSEKSDVLKVEKSEYQCEIPEGDITPNLIEKITTSNLELKKRLYSDFDDPSMDRDSIMSEIRCNCEFILYLFHYDNELRQYVEPSHKETDNQNNIENEIIEELKGNKIRQGRMNV